MGKVKGWLMTMEEDAMWMSRDSWIARHGSTHVSVFDDVQAELEGRQVQEAREMVQEQIDRLEAIFSGRRKVQEQIALLEGVFGGKV